MWFFWASLGPVCLCFLYKAPLHPTLWEFLIPDLLLWSNNLGSRCAVGQYGHLPIQSNFNRRMGFGQENTTFLGIAGNQGLEGLYDVGGGSWESEGLKAAARRLEKVTKTSSTKHWTGPGGYQKVPRKLPQFSSFQK